MITTRSLSHGLRALALTALPAGLLSAQAPVTLTLGGAARLAAQWNAAPVAAKERVSQADARVRQRRADFLPNFSIAASDVERTFNSASMGISFRDATTGKFLFDPNGQILGPVRAWDLRGSLTQKIVDLGAFARLRAAQASAGAATADVSVAAQQAAAAAAAAYVRAARADAQLGARIADSTLAAELLGIARDQLAAGVGIALDVTRAQAQLATARAQLIGARNERNRARLELNRALGVPPSQEVLLADSLATLATATRLPSEQDAIDEALRDRADLKSAGEATRAAERQIEALRAERLPTLGLFVDQGENGKATQHLIPTYTWGISLSVPIFDGFRREGRIDEQRAVIRELGVRRRDLADQAATDVRGALLDLASAREQLAAQEERLALANQELAQARDRFTAGVAGNADVITASIALNAARTQLVDARAAYQGARLALARAQGTVTDLP
jgi:outer membrane protein